MSAYINSLVFIKFVWYYYSGKKYVRYLISASISILIRTCNLSNKQIGTKQLLVLIATQYKMPKKLLKVQNAIFRFVPKSMFQQMGFGKSDFLKLCNTMMELDFSDSIYKVSCPTLVIYGEKDRANQNASIELANMLIDAELQVFSGAGHEINIEAPDKLVETLRVFFSRV